jgi:hypothetical protein
MEHGVKFKGNLIFQSHNAFKQLTLSRRDDLISLANLIAYLFRGGFKWTKEINTFEPLLPQVTKIRSTIT